MARSTHELTCDSPNACTRRTPCTLPEGENVTATRPFSGPSEHVLAEAEASASALAMLARSGVPSLVGDGAGRGLAPTSSAMAARALLLREVLLGAELELELERDEALLDECDELEP